MSTFIEFLDQADSGKPSAKPRTTRLRQGWRLIPPTSPRPGRPLVGGATLFFNFIYAMRIIMTFVIYPILRGVFRPEMNRVLFFIIMNIGFYMSKF